MAISLPGVHVFYLALLLQVLWVMATPQKNKDDISLIGLFQVPLVLSHDRPHVDMGLRVRPEVSHCHLLSKQVTG